MEAGLNAQMSQLFDCFSSHGEPILPNFKGFAALHTGPEALVGKSI